MYLLGEKVLARISQKLSLLKKARPLPTSIVKKLREQFTIEMTYNSNAIEGNQLTLRETELVLNDGITIKGKSLRDHLEAKNHYEAIQFLYEWVETDRKQSFSEHTIRSLHSLIVKDTEERAGTYRTGSVMITGSKHSPPEAHEIPHLMQNFVKWLGANQYKLHPIELAALAHHKLAHIHPFFDGNGRTARMLMNLILLQREYPLIIILKNDRKKYYEALANGDAGNFKPIVGLIARAVERSLNIYLKVIAPSRSTNSKYLPLSVIAKRTSYTEKHLNLLARSGQIDAHKEGRNWVTSMDAIKKYQKDRKRQVT